MYEHLTTPKDLFEANNFKDQREPKKTDDAIVFTFKVVYA